MTDKRTPEEDLLHYGVKGMKWGVRKSEDTNAPVLKAKTDDISVTLKNGDTLSLSGHPTSAMMKLFARINPSKIEEYNSRQSFKIVDKNGSRVGEMALRMDSPTSLNVRWIGIKGSARGNGYASASMNAAVEHARKKGLKAVTLEVPGNAPDARHIYEKMGFREVYTPPEMKEIDPIWGGLTNMRLDLEAKHDSLKHYGVKGMKWGVIRSDEELGNAKASSEDSKKGSSGKPSSSAEKYKKAHKPPGKPSTKQAADNLAKNQEKFDAKFESSDKEQSKLKKFVSDNKKELKKTAAIGGTIAALVLLNAAYEKKTRASIEEYSGKKIDPVTFKQHVGYSKAKTWAENDYLKGDAFDRPEFSLAAGHTFHRISKAPETSFNLGTYATHNKADYDRYIAQFRQELGSTDLHHVTFQAKEEIKVPALSTVLDALKATLSGGVNGPRQADDATALRVYQQLSGGSWDDSRAGRLFETLMSKGYGAIVDEMDAGVIGQSPLVVFAEHLLGPKSSNPITPEDIAHSEASLTEITNRKY